MRTFGKTGVYTIGINCLVNEHIVTKSCNNIIFYSGFKSTLYVRIILVTAGAEVIFLITVIKTCCRNSINLNHFGMVTSKLINRSIFVTLFTTNGALLMLDTICIKSRLLINNPTKAMRKHFLLYLSRIRTSGTGFICVPTDSGTSRLLCLVIDNIVSKSINALSLSFVTYSTGVSLNPIVCTGRSFGLFTVVPLMIFC